MAVLAVPEVQLCPTSCDPACKPGLMRSRLQPCLMQRCQQLDLDDPAY